MSKVTTRPDRPLGYLEKYQTSKQLTRAYGNISLTAQLEHASYEGETAETFYMRQFQPALTRLIETHAALSMVIRDKTESTAHFEQLSSIDLAKAVEITTAHMSLQDLITEQTSTEFDLDAALPLWRLKVIAESSTTCTVAFAMHHAIGDGMSLHIFWQAFLQELNSDKKVFQDKSSVVDVKESKLPPPYELSNAPSVSVVWDVVPVVLKSLIPKVLPTSIARIVDPVGTDGWKGDSAAVEGEAHHTEVRLIHVPLDIWKPITNECKQRGISGHAIVFVAMLLAWKRLYPGKTTEVATPINCRGLCNPPVSKNQIGNFVGAYTSVWTGKQLENSQDIWTMAKKYHQDLQNNKLEAGKEALFLKYLPEFPASYCDYWYDKRKSSPLGRTGGLELSDLGKFTFTNNTWKLNQMYFCQSAQTFTTAFGMNSISVNDNLYCTLDWQKGSLDDSKTSLYHDIFIGILKDVPLSLQHN